MKLYMIIAVVGIICFYTTGVTLIKERNAKKENDINIPFNSQESSFELTHSGKYSFGYAFSGSVSKQYFERPKIEIVDSSGNKYVPSSFTNSRSSTFGTVTYGMGSLKLKKGEYTLKASPEELQKFAAYNGSINLSTASTIAMVAAVFCFVFPSISFILVMIANFTT